MENSVIIICAAIIILMFVQHAMITHPNRPPEKLPQAWKTYRINAIIVLILLLLSAFLAIWVAAKPNLAPQIVQLVCSNRLPSGLITALVWGMLIAIFEDLVTANRGRLWDPWLIWLALSILSTTLFEFFLRNSKACDLSPPTSIPWLAIGLIFFFAIFYAGWIYSAMRRQMIEGDRFIPGTSKRFSPFDLVKPLPMQVLLLGPKFGGKTELAKSADPGGYGRQIELLEEQGKSRETIKAGTATGHARFIDSVTNREQERRVDIIDSPGEMMGSQTTFLSNYRVDGAIFVINAEAFIEDKEELLKPANWRLNTIYNIIDSGNKDNRAAFFLDTYIRSFEYAVNRGAESDSEDSTNIGCLGVVINDGGSEVGNRIANLLREDDNTDTAKSCVKTFAESLADKLNRASPPPSETAVGDVRVLANELLTRIAEIVASRP